MFSLPGGEAESENKKGPSIQKMPRPFPRLRMTILRQRSLRAWRRSQTGGL